MKNVILLHGTSCTPDLFWFPYIKQNLEKKGYKVQAPQLPNSDEPRVDTWVPFVLDNFEFDENTILIGHSAGCPLILSILEKINIKISQAILVAGFVDELKSDILQKKYNEEKIKSNVEDIIYINSNDDPWGCDHKQGLKMYNKFGGTLILKTGEGHMGSTTKNQPYKQFPLLLSLIK